MATSIDQVIIRRIQLRSDTESEWGTENPVLAEGEFGVSYPDKIVKIGDGVTEWDALLPYTGPLSEEVTNILELDSEGKLVVHSQIDDDEPPSADKTFSSERIAELTTPRLNVINIALEDSTLEPAQAGRGVYIRYTRVLGTTVLLDVAQTYEAGMLFNIRAAAGLVTLETLGVTLNMPPNSSNIIPVGGSVSIAFVSPTEADVAGYLELN